MSLGTRVPFCYASHFLGRQTSFSRLRTRSPSSAISIAYAEGKPEISRNALNQILVRIRSTGWVVGRPRPLGVTVVGTIIIWSTENRIIGSGGENVYRREHCVTTAWRYLMNALPEQIEAVTQRNVLSERLLRLHGSLQGRERFEVAAIGRSRNSKPLRSCESHPSAACN